MKCKKICGIAAISIMIAASLMSCGDTPLGERIVEEKVVPPSDLYGSYWGDWLVMTQSVPMCAVITENTLSYYSTMKSGSYTNIAYTQNAETEVWTLSAYDESDTAQTTPKVTMEFAYNNETKEYSAEFSVVAMAAMGAPADLTVGDAYDGKYNSQSALYGSYWGNFDVMTQSIPICAVITENSLDYYSDGSMTGGYTNIAYTQNAETKVWTLSAYAETDTDQATAKVTMDFAYNKETQKYSAEFKVVAMAAMGATGSLTAGDAYDGEYDPE